ncbi:MAG: hypothetical protein NTX04_05180, partial [Verrucomicrobia bacterium]|nr:hypothetical protein [Verrucomicrobiota bacterium]
APSPPPSPPSTLPALPALPEILPNLPSLFHSLPEPGRSALALFYLHLFSNSEIAELLLLPLDSLPALIGSTRLQLASSLHP